MSGEEIYISVDVEASGPIPGEFSMLSIGACVASNTKQTFYIELQPDSDKFDSDAIAVAGFKLADLKKKGAPPAEAMQKFEDWIKKVSGKKAPVLVAFNASLDWMFACYYFHKYLKRNIFGWSAIDVRAVYMGKLNTSWKDTERRHIKKEFLNDTPHTHNGLDDAIGAAEMFNKLRLKNN